MSKYYLYYIHKKNKVNFKKKQQNLTVVHSVRSTSTIYDKYYDTKKYFY